MSNRATFTLADEAFDYLKQVGSENKSAFVNHLLLEEKKRNLKQAILRANHEEAEDEDYQKELAVWDGTLADGLNP